MSLSRRSFLSSAALAAASAAWPLIPVPSYGVVRRRPAFVGDPFSLGVASGDPTPTGVVLWTRLAPRPLEGGGMPDEAVEVAWEVAEDEDFSRGLRSGTAVATADLAHSVHAEVEGLEPGRAYFYRFHAGPETSPVGRTRTAPAPGAAVGRFRFAFASCQNYEAGLYTAYRHMAAEDLDLVVHLGDYIYEGPGKEGALRRHVGGETITLEDYRTRHALYRSDADLQAAHAAFPWAVTWDDHEVDNNYADRIPEKAGADPAAFVARRAAAYKAYYEHMPLRRASVPTGPDMRLYRRLTFGGLADIFVLDTRQYRSDQPPRARAATAPGGALDPSGTMLGGTQKAWLKGGLAGPGATWNVLAQQVMFAPVDRQPGDGERRSTDQWPGYERERRELLAFFAEAEVRNPVVITGDIHSNWASDLHLGGPDTPVVATEYVGTSISSGGNGSRREDRFAEVRAENPFVKFHNAERGYVSCELTPTLWRSDYRVVEEVTKPGGPVATRAAFVTEAGRPGALPA